MPFVARFAGKAPEGGFRAEGAAFALARRIEDGRHLIVLASTSTPAEPHARFSFIACDPGEVVMDRLDPLDGMAAPDFAIERAGDPDAAQLARVAPRFIGVLPYEAMRTRLERASWSAPEVRPAPLLGRVAWMRFEAVLVIDRLRDAAFVVADDEARARAFARRFEAEERPRAPLALDVRDREPPTLHVARVRAAIERIYEGDFYQVNLARELLLSLSPPTRSAALDLAENLVRAAPSPFGAFLDVPLTADGGASAWVVSTSPELLLEASSDERGERFARLVTEPIKGTRQRGRDPGEDASLVRELDGDPKERAELAMIIDVERNDVGRVCDPRSIRVEPPRVVTHRTIHHRVARVEGTVKAGRSREDVLSAMLPSGSVTGAPKVRAMEAIAELEPMRRGLYTGGLGYLARDGSMVLSMAIRTAVLDPSGAGRYLVGGGIVADSDPERELEETRWKAAQLAEVAARANAPVL